MKYNQLGQTDMKISDVSLGTWTRLLKQPLLGR